MTVLGRWSVCINTGGEKVHPEEVETVLLRHGAGLTEEELRAHARSLISNYKVPKQIVYVDHVPRTAVSKVDYRASLELALRSVERAHADA